MKKSAILVVSFGTSYKDTLEKNISAIEKKIAQSFPTYSVKRAFTSGMILRKLAKGGEFIDDVASALEKLLCDGFTEVLIQPTHLMNGDEYDKLCKEAKPFLEKFDFALIGRPLLSTVEDYRQTVKALLSKLPSQEKETAIVYMGHGSTHFANSAYCQLEYMFHDMGREDVFIGTVEGYPELPQVVKKLNKLKENADLKKIMLYPLMIVAGDHATNDMASDEDDSWKSMLLKEGYQVETVLEGLGENPFIQEIFVDHAKEIRKKRNTT